MVDWKKQANWWEAEGSKPRIRRRRLKKGVAREVQPLFIVSQDIARSEIPNTLCQELKRAGFRARILIDHPKRTLKCYIGRVEEIDCYLRKILPYLISKDRREAVIKFREEIVHFPKRARIPFRCPD